MYCGRDCSALARTKDPRGRYVCLECLEQARRARDARTPVIPEFGSPATGELRLPTTPDRPELDRLSAGVLDVGRPAIPPGHEACPHCGAVLAPEVVLCVSCGFNRKTGERSIIRIKRRRP